jgi:hypothetical protein
VLGSGPPQLRDRAVESLSLLTNQRFAGTAGDEGSWARAKERYDALWKKLSKSPRDAWLALGFEAAGYKVRAIDKKNAWELVRATAAEPHLSFNAQRLLARIAGEPAGPTVGAADEACAYYLRVFRDRRSLHMDKPPATVTRACSAAKKT